MIFPPRRIWLSAGLGALVLCSSNSVSGDANVPKVSSTHQFRCYCQCEKHGGHKTCTMKMCEIPKYEKRWWATSCHRRATDTPPSNAPAFKPTGRHTRHILDAKNQTEINPGS